MLLLLLNNIKNIHCDAGSWSDRHRRRKPCMLIPLIGEMLSAIGLMAAAYFQHCSLGVTVFLEVIFPAATGNYYY